jgi:hypothetical protein
MTVSRFSHRCLDLPMAGAHNTSDKGMMAVIGNMLAFAVAASYLKSSARPPRRAGADDDKEWQRPQHTS